MAPQVGDRRYERVRDGWVQFRSAQFLGREDEFDRSRGGEAVSSP
jgi:hypothetical protein